ncbi:zinc finger protein 862 [Nothobranchius furzeri]|uniref:zinc finger protein 862 n=1 Tax=Nothobranchius furzeri TaxID=105023 RepID=UPI0039047C00
MLEILAAVVEEPILKDIQSSVAIGLEIDESTDVFVTRQLDLHVRYMDAEGKLYSQFLGLVALSDGKANTIVAALNEVLVKKKVPTEKLFGLGTDGAAVMTGRLSGVAKQMQDSLPWLLSVACAAHRLALACKDASSEVPYMGTFRDHLQSLHLYFHNSANRTAVLRAASQVLGLDNLTVKEVKDTRWLSQHLAVSNLQRNLCAVLGALAEEVDSNKCPLAKGLYSYCCKYRFVAAIYLQADVLPHLARLSKIFQKENVNFLAIKDQVPVTIACLQDIKDAGNTKAGSFLAQLQTDLDDPTRLGAFGILPEEERGRRGRGQEEYSQGMLWPRFRSEVMEPYIDALLDSLDRRFQNIDVMSAFHVLGPQTLTEDDAVATANVLTLSRKFLPQQPESTLSQEWASFKKHMVTGAFKDLDQLSILQKLSAQNDEWANLYPMVSKLAAIAMTVPISSVNCERDFSTMNRVKTDLRNRLQGDHLAACLQLSINGPPLGEFPYHRALEMFCKKSRKIKCQIPPSKVCQ